MNSAILARKSLRGFTLLELVLVMILVGIAAVPVLGMFNQVNRSLLVSQDAQLARQLVHEQAEQLLADKRNLGFNAASLNPGSITVNLPAPFAGMDRTVSIATHNSTSLGACPAGASCKLVQVDVSLAGGGRLLATTNFMIVQ